MIEEEFKTLSEMTPLFLKDPKAFDLVRSILPDSLNINEFEVMNYYPAEAPNRTTVTLVHHSGLSLSISFTGKPELPHKYPSHPKKLLL